MEEDEEEIHLSASNRRGRHPHHVIDITEHCLRGCASLTLAWCKDNEANDRFHINTTST
jgi:hypothetical protein